MATVANRPRLGYYTQVPTVAPWFPIPSVLPACYCLDRRCVFKSLATPGLSIENKQGFHNHYMHTCVLRATVMTVEPC